MRTNTNTFVRDFVQVADAMNRVWGRFPYDYAHNGGNTGKGQSTEKRAAYIPIDARANEDAFVLTTYLPGVNPEDVEITFEDDKLTVKGSFPAADSEATYVKQELFHGAFERSLNFNVPIDEDKIEAEFENGVLTLTVPKAEAVKPKQIKVVAR